MLINAANLDTLRVGFKTNFQNGIGQATSQYAMIATEVMSSVKEQKYGWLGKIPNVREWIGGRAVHSLMQHDYAIREKAWELTIGVDRDDIETDNLGIYSPMFTEMGRSTQAKMDMLCFDLLKNGWANPCYDGQNYFDTDHPVLDENGVEASVANTDGGSGTPWFLMDSTRALKPIILQKRKDWEFVAKDRLTDDNVFDNKEFVYGSDARFNAGYGFWQFVWGSKQTLDASSYGTARAALQSMKGDFGRPLGIMPNLLVVPPTLEKAANDILKATAGVGGASNTWHNTAQVAVVPWLA